MAKNSIYFRPDTGAPITPQEAKRLGLNVIPEDLPESVPDVSTTPVQQDIVTQTVQASRSPNTVEQQFGSFGNPFGSVRDLLSKGAKNVGEGFSLAGERIGNTLSGIGDWASENRIGLGGLGTAIGAGLAGRDASEALSRYNQSIIANKQQQAREEELRIQNDSSHPYNQQFRNLFKQLIPDVAVKLGDNFEKMTVKNFKDAGLTDLLDVTQKRIAIDMSDRTSEVSKRAREMASTQYGIPIPDNISANEVKAYIDDHNKKIEQGLKEREVETKEETARSAKQRAIAEAAYKAILGEEAINEREIKQKKLDLEKEEGERKAELFPTEKAIKEAQKEKAQFENKVQKLNEKQLIDKPKLENKLLNKKIQDIDNDYNLGLKKLQVQERIANRQIGSARDRLLTRINFDKQKLRDELKYKYDALAHRDKIENLKLSYQNPEGTVNQKILDNAGLSKQALKELVQYSSDSETMKDYMNQLKGIITKKGRYAAYSDQAIRGQMASLHAQILAKIKDKDKLGALDKGVLEYVDRLITNPTELSNAFSNSTKIVSQLNTALEGTSTEQRNKYIGSKWDPRMARDIGSFQKLVNKAYKGDKQSVLKFQEYGYTEEQIVEFYDNRLPVIGGDED